MRYLHWLWSVGLGLFLLGCSPASEPEVLGGDDVTRVVATVGMIGDLVERVAAGGAIEVTTLIQPGIDPHLYKPTRTDIGRLQAADVIFYNGLNLEGKMTQAFEQAERAGAAVVAVGERLPESRRLGDPERPTAADPHLWMDPSRWAGVVDVVADTLAEASPGAEAEIRANAAALSAELAELDADAEATLARVPTGRRVLVTAHDAFQYFGDRFDFEVLGVQGLSTESEAGVRDIERLVSTLVDREVGAVFVESTVSSRNVEALIAGAAARGHEVRIGGELFSDAMGPAGTPEATYGGMIRHNVDTIADALGAGPGE